MQLRTYLTPASLALPRAGAEIWAHIFPNVQLLSQSRAQVNIFLVNVMLRMALNVQTLPGTLTLSIQWQAFSLELKTSHFRIQVNN